MRKNTYSTNCKGIGGQIKRRYTDFVVEEVTPGGRACKANRFIGEYDWEKHEPGLKIPKRSGEEQLCLDLEKINKDLNFCISKISRFLQCSKKRIGYAGLKDKRAVTCQRISIFDPNLERLAAFSSRGIDLRNPKWGNERVEIGDLSGNGFTIIIRDISLEEKVIKERVKGFFSEVKGQGIANFFGEQRFGGVRQITHLVGKEFVNGHPEKAIMLYLTATFPKEDEEIKAARLELAKSGDFSRASKEFPVKFRYERAIIHYLCKYPRDFVGAFRELPKALRYLFTHAYQSYLFNRIISERLELGWGLKKVKGDILLDGKPTAPLFGFESKLAEGEPGEIEKSVLEEEGISLKNFKVKEMPELSSKGAKRKIVLRPQKLKFLGTGEDEFFEGKRFAKISFELEKGSYATTVLRELMKVEG